MFLDEISPMRVSPIFGKLGRGGSLGYEGLYSHVNGIHYEHAISAHPSSQVTYSLATQAPWARHFSCKVALNDTSRDDKTCEFRILIDGTAWGCARKIAKGMSPVTLDVAIPFGSKELTLETRTQDNFFCHGIWLDPLLGSEEKQEVFSPLGHLWATSPKKHTASPSGVPPTLCIGITFSPEVIAMTRSLLFSIRANAGLFTGYPAVEPEEFGCAGCAGCADCADCSGCSREPAVKESSRADLLADIALFCVRPTPACAELAEEFGAIFIPCSPAIRVLPPQKYHTIAYAAASLLPHEHFVLMDADMLVQDSFQPLLGALESIPADYLLAVKDIDISSAITLGEALKGHVYQGNDDLLRAFDLSEDAKNYKHIVNVGFLAGNRVAFLSMANALHQKLDAFWHWERESLVDRQLPIGEQFWYNLGFARLDSCIPLDTAWNLQLGNGQRDDAIPNGQGGYLSQISGRAARVIHFVGETKWTHKRFYDVLMNRLREP